MLVVGADERVAEVVAMLTSPAAIQPAAPRSGCPFPFFAFPHHVTALNGPEYRESFPDVSAGPAASISNNEVASRSEPSSAARRGFNPNDVVCALPMGGFQSLWE